MLILTVVWLGQPWDCRVPGWVHTEDE